MIFVSDGILKDMKLEIMEGKPFRTSESWSIQDATIPRLKRPQQCPWQRQAVWRPDTRLPTCRR